MGLGCGGGLYGLGAGGDGFHGAIEQAQGRTQIELGLIVMHHRVDVLEAGGLQRILRLEHGDGEQRARLQVGLGEAEGFVRGGDLLTRQGNDGGLSEAGLMSGNDGSANRYEEFP